MTQEDKELLIKDLSARLSYEVKGQAKGMIKFFADEEVSEEPWTLTSINVQLNTFGADTQTGIPLFNRRTGICNFKPYLFPMSSMTKEQQEEFDRIYANDMQVVADNLKNILDGQPYEVNLGHYRHIDWLNKNHFDYRGLIPRGLANNATGLNIY